MKRFSYSQFDLYSQCPRKYKHRYIDKLRSPKLPSPLFFGSALDEAFSHLLSQKLEHPQPQEFTAEEVFVQHMQIVKDARKNPVELPKNVNADYFNTDFTAELLLPEHLPNLKEFEQHYKLVDFLDFHEQCREQMKAKNKLLPDDQALYNYMTWLTLVEKGKLLVGAYRDIVMPQISRVESIQERISLTNDDGDEITGLIDFRASFIDNPELVYTLDNKSSSVAYKEDCVQDSDQLATYCEAKGSPHAGYVVVEKKLFKKEPKIHINVHKGVIPEEKFQQVFDKFEKTCYSVQAGEFPKNEDSCFAFGRPCEFLRLCKYQDKSDLIDVT